MPGRRSTRTPLLSGDGPLAKVPPVVVFALVAAVFVTGIVLGGLLGAILLGLLAAGVGVLLATTWHVLSPQQRLARALILAILGVIAVSVLLTK